MYVLHCRSGGHTRGGTSGQLAPRRVVAKRALDPGVHIYIYIYIYYLDSKTMDSWIDILPFSHPIQPIQAEWEFLNG